MNSNVNWIWIFNLCMALFVMYDSIDHLYKIKRDSIIRSKFLISYNKFLIWFTSITSLIAIYAIVNNYHF